MAGLEGIIRPFVGESTAPTPFRPGNSTSAPPVRFAIGIIGGSKTFGFSNSSSLSSYMAAVHTEKTTTIFDMTTGKLSG